MRLVRQQECASTTGSVASPGGGRHRSSRTRGRWFAVGTLLAVGLLGPAAFLVYDMPKDTPHRAPSSWGVASVPPTPTPAPSPSPTPTEIEVPPTGTGTFVTAPAGGAPAGDGPRPLRYVVRVETGIAISPARAADEISEILAAPRGWTDNRSYAFRLVGAGEPHDLTVTIATPGTADALCWAGIRQDTGGEYNCEVSDGVVVNLKRWVKGSPTFDGPIHDYRALIINHEMGHFLGYAHTTCAGPGQLAPVMMQQIKGLHGCIANAWPYDENGQLVTGPPAK
ncbi:DUF3152 domain-containing protein [Streptomyces marokkonensis]|uniref:DUF3152 domain-containing protein n=1 Tax=Streptomyces marokkonensis TaxID=324855 RepID=A0ABW6QFM5_9ACTN